MQVVLAYGAESDRKLGIPGEVGAWLGTREGPDRAGANQWTAVEQESHDQTHKAHRPLRLLYTVCAWLPACCAERRKRLCSAGVCVVVQRAPRRGKGRFRRVAGCCRLLQGSLAGPVALPPAPLFQVRLAIMLT